MYSTDTTENMTQRKQDAKRKELIGIAVTLLGALMLLINYILNWTIQFGAYFATLTVTGALVSVYYERKHYSLKIQLEKRQF